MIFRIVNTLFGIFLVVCLLWSPGFTDEPVSGDQWQNPFRSAPEQSDSSHDSLTLVRVLSLVGEANPTLKAGLEQIEAAKGSLTQAGLWPNPELDIGMEEVGWDASGFKQNELTIALSQELEVFGQRNARKEVAKAEIASTTFETKLRAFDLYLQAKRLFFKLYYAQNKATLADSSVALAEHIVNSIEYRMKQGVALESALLLAQLELQRIRLDREQIQQELYSSQVELVALWNGDRADIAVSASDEPNLKSILEQIPALNGKLDSTRYVKRIQHSIEMDKAEKELVTKQAKPNITMSGGYKRLELDNTNTFVVGVSLPLPFFNRNQGSTASLSATILSKEYEQKQLITDTKAFINSATSRLNQLIDRHITLDTLLLPTAEIAYNTIKETYSVGRIAYTTFLEAERSLIDLRFEHNDILIAIHEQLIAIEQISGIRIYE